MDGFKEVGITFEDGLQPFHQYLIRDSILAICALSYSFKALGLVHVHSQLALHLRQLLVLFGAP